MVVSGTFSCDTSPLEMKGVRGASRARAKYAVVLATQPPVADSGFERLGSPATLALMGKPILLHVLEYVESLGISNTVVVCKSPDVKALAGQWYKHSSMHVETALDVEAAAHVLSNRFSQQLCEEDGSIALLQGDWPPYEGMETLLKTPKELSRYGFCQAMQPLDAAQYYHLNLEALAGRHALRHIPGWEASPGVWLQWAPGVPPRAIAGSVHIGRGAEASGSAHLEECIIGAHTMIGRNTRVVRSVLAPYARVPDGAVIEDTVLGPRVRIAITQEQKDRLSPKIPYTATPVRQAG